jgi:cytochrome P450
VAQRFLLVVGTAKGLKQVFQTGQRKYEKDLDFSFQPFLPILGTGLVTAHGDLWQQQRLLIGPALRVDILGEVPGIAMRAAGRLCSRLEEARGTGQAVDMEVEFRLMTLQIIGEAVLSLHPDECDRVCCPPCIGPRSDCWCLAVSLL